MALEGFLDVSEPTSIVGWAWNSEHPEVQLDVEILLDGVPLGQANANGYRHDLEECKIGDGHHAFWFIPTAPLDDVGKIKVKILGTDVYLLRHQQEIPVPPDDLIFLVVGARNITPQFLATGAADLNSIKALLDEAEFKLKPGSRVLDWGCGCGRVARHWAPKADEIYLYGCDINDHLVTWSKQNIPFGSFTCSELRPPLPYTDSYFDLVYGISVFTHLLFDTHYLWMAELWRVLKPGGIAILTAHGPSMFPKIAGQFAAGNKTNLVDGGMFISVENVEGSNQTGNIVTADVMSKIFYPFEQLDYRPCYGLMGIHDTYVFAKKSCSTLQLIPSLLECEMQGNVFEKQVMEVTNSSQRQCAVLASAKNLLFPATIQLSFHFPDSDMRSVVSRVLRLPEKVSWTGIHTAYVFVTLDNIPQWDGRGTLSVQVKSYQPLNGVILQLHSCIFL